MKIACVTEAVQRKVVAVLDEHGITGRPGRSQLNIQWPVAVDEELTDDVREELREVRGATIVGEQAA